MYEKILHFFNEGVWQAQIRKLPKWKAILFRFIRIIVLTIQGFTKSQIQQGASALTYYTLLALVPVIALLIAVARVFLLESSFETWILQKFSNQQEVARQVFHFATASLKEASQGVIAGVGIALLFWTAIKILTNLEWTMNQIWEVREGRPLAKRFTDYIALIILAPLIIFLSSGLNVYIAHGITDLGKEAVLFKKVGSILLPIFQLIIPFIVTGFLWTFLYIFIPNTKVSFLPALIAGFITALAYSIIQWIYYKLQIGASSYNAIYGTFAAFPLFLIWLHLSWVLTLLGAKIAFAIQNVDAYGYISEKAYLSHRFRTLCSLLIANHCTKKFIKGEVPPTSIEISNSLSIPHSLISFLLYRLSDAGILSEVKRKKDQEIGFQPARSTDSLTIKHVIDMIEGKGEEISLPPSNELTKIFEIFDKFGSNLEKSDSNVLLKDL